MTSLLTLALLLLAVSISTPAHAQTCPAYQQLFFNGHILTGEGLQQRHPEMVTEFAIRDGHIVAAQRGATQIGATQLGATQISAAHIGATQPTDLSLARRCGVKVVDLHGAFVMPGFNDAHVHTGLAGRQRLAVDLVGTHSLAEMLARVRTYIAALPPGTSKTSWLTGGGWDHTLWPSKTLPTRQELDAVTGAHPALLERVDGHIAIANTAALRAADITADTPNPAGGRFDHAAMPKPVDPGAAIASPGELTGIVREAPALVMIQRIIPPPEFATRRKALQMSIDDALAHGVTSIQDYSDWDDWLVYEEMEHAGTLHLRVAEWIDFNLPLKVLEQRRASHDANDPLLHLTFLKGFMDGSLGSRTAALNAPYTDDPTNSGLARYDQQKLNQMSAERVAAGFQLGFHAIGDRANDMALNAFAAAEQLAPSPTTLRLRIEHAQVVGPGDFARFKALGVIASMQPSHLLTDMNWAGDRLGPARERYAYAWGSFLHAGVPLCFGTDYPVESINPFRGLYAATTRMNVEGTKTFDPAHAAEETLTLPEAIYAYTQASAYAEFREHVKGTLTPGMLADFIVLDRNILQASPQQLLHTRVLATYVGGQKVFDAATASTPAEQAPQPDND
jgi:predicted amidohydrolase YtcJ